MTDVNLLFMLYHSPATLDIPYVLDALSGQLQRHFPAGIRMVGFPCRTASTLTSVLMVRISSNTSGGATTPLPDGRLHSGSSRSLLPQHSLKQLPTVVLHPGQMERPGPPVSLHG